MRITRLCTLVCSWDVAPWGRPAAAVTGARVPAGSQEPRPQLGPRAWCRSHREGVQAALVFWALWSNEHLGRPSFHLAKRSWKVWSCYGFDNKAFQLRNRPWPGSGGVILLPGQVWAWEEREFRALEPVPSSGVGGGSARRGWGSDARLTEYLEVARLGTSLHKAQRGAADTRERGSLSL